MNGTDPETPDEWQEAVDLAHVCLSIDSARQYGLVETGMRFGVERCQELLRRGAERGIAPRGEAVEEFVKSLQPVEPQETAKRRRRRRAKRRNKS